MNRGNTSFFCHSLTAVFLHFLIGENLQNHIGVDRLKIDEADGEICLKVNVRKNKDAARLHEMLCAWRQAAAMLKAGEITQEEYDRWRYHYPEYDTSGLWHKVTPSHGLSDILVEALKKKEN